MNREQRRWLEKLIRQGVLIWKPKEDERFYVDENIRYKYPSLESYVIKK